MADAVDVKDNDDITDVAKSADIAEVDPHFPSLHSNQASERPTILQTFSSANTDVSAQDTDVGQVIIHEEDVRKSPGKKADFMMTPDLQPLQMKRLQTDMEGISLLDSERVRQFNARQPKLLVLEVTPDGKRKLRTIQRNAIYEECHRVAMCAAIIRNKLTQEAEKEQADVLRAYAEAQQLPSSGDSLPPALEGKLPRETSNILSGRNVNAVSLLHNVRASSEYVRSLRKLPAHELRMRYETELKLIDQLRAMEGTVKPRDLRKIDPTFLTSSEPALIVRRYAFVFNAISVRGIVLYDKCFLIVPDGADSILEVFVDRLTSGDSEREGAHVPSLEFPHMGAVPFEFKALEALLLTTQVVLEAGFEALEQGVKEHLALVRQNITSVGLELLKNQQSEINIFNAKVRGIRDAIAELLGDDEDMSHLYLAKLQRSPHIWEQPLLGVQHEEVECILETYLEAVDSMMTNINLLTEEMKNTSNLIEIELDSARNKFLKVNVLLQLITLGVAIGSFVAGLFGMNLYNKFEDSDTAFRFVVTVTSCGAALIVAVVYQMLVRSGQLV